MLEERDRELRREREGLNEGERMAKKLGEEGKGGHWRSQPEKMAERERRERRPREGRDERERAIFLATCQFPIGNFKYLFIILNLSTSFINVRLAPENQNCSYLGTFENSILAPTFEIFTTFPTKNYHFNL